MGVGGKARPAGNIRHIAKGCNAAVASCARSLKGARHAVRGGIATLGSGTPCAVGRALPRNGWQTLKR